MKNHNNSDDDIIVNVSKSFVEAMAMKELEIDALKQNYEIQKQIIDMLETKVAWLEFGIISKGKLSNQN